jgi:hypothetical protein
VRTEQQEKYSNYMNKLVSEWEQNN